jgi:branched-chain amino acid transport system ATP-binding protein
MLQVENLVASYDEIVALKGIHLEVREGEVVALIGANGAGKTTVLRVLSGLLRPRRGTIVFRGEVLNGWTPDRIVALWLVDVPEGRHIFPLLTVQGNLLVASHLIPRKAEVRRNLEHVFQLFPRLADRRRQLGGTLSGGSSRCSPSDARSWRSAPDPDGRTLTRTRPHPGRGGG